MGPYTLSAPGNYQLLNAATTGAGGVLLLRGETARLTLTFQSNGTTTGGTITIEEAYYDPSGPVYDGTWSAIGAVVSASTFTGSKQLVTHATGSFWAVRARISSDITGGGTVSVWAWGN